MGSDIGKPDFPDAQGSATSGAAAADFSNVQSQVGSMVDETINYIVAAGDTLSKIAEHFYGTANAWKSIFDANRNQLVDPGRIEPGQILEIPPQS